jgi:hypothetical protein
MHVKLNASIVVIVNQMIQINAVEIRNVSCWLSPRLWYKYKMRLGSARFPESWIACQTRNLVKGKMPILSEKSYHKF